MGLGGRIRLGLLAMLLRLWRPRRPGNEDQCRQDFSTHPGGKGLRFTERLRNRLRRSWLRYREPPVL